MRYLFLILFCLSSINTYAQEEWLISNIKTESDFLNPRDIIPLVNEDTKDIVLFFTNRKVVFGKLYNQNKALIGSINNIKIPKKGKVIIGAIYNNDTYTLFFSNTNKTHFSSVSINFITNKFNITEDLNIKLDKEKIVEFLVRKNKIHLLTVSKKNDVLKTLTITEKGVIQSFEYDLSKENIVNNIDQDYPLYPLLFGNPSYSTIEIINNNVPNSLEQTNAITKLYLNNNTLTITSNLFDKSTYIISLDLETNTYNFQNIINTGFNDSHRGANSNSFIYNDKLLTIYSTLDHLSFSAYNLKNLTLLKTFQINKEDKIDFKNTPIIQEGGEFDNYRELEKNSKFLRKITQSKIGITAYTKNDQLIITLGASKEIAGNNFAMVNFGLVGGIAFGLLTNNLYNYSQTKSTRISCLFDDNLNHIKGHIPLNDFDKIEKFKQNNSAFNNPNLQTLFKYNSSYLLGNYDKKNGLYSLFKFDF
ncbi:hypothetical protein [Olleya namhaensis]|uniref:hypothetical protein n=1 Tax=Olleya namhaensis TaxID=1144750 RepID=UPI002492EECB|nr:hypothetical protein [Olleya namhaensis]